MTQPGLSLEDLGLPIGPEHPCSYLPGLRARERAFFVQNIPSGFYRLLMDNGWRRSGHVIYKPFCAECSACVPIRVPVDSFRPNRIQRRLLARNADIVVSHRSPRPERETFDLFCRYQNARHDGTMCTTWEEFGEFLCASPVDTREYLFHLDGRLVAVAVADVEERGISAVYTYFDPAVTTRSLGTFAILWFILHARERRVPHYYLGYYIAQCAKMNYKVNFRPYEVGDGRGNWRLVE